MPPLPGLGYTDIEADGTDAYCIERILYGKRDLVRATLEARITTTRGLTDPA